MFRHIMNVVIDEFNTGLCLRDIANHWRCRCTVPGPGMRAAGQLLVDRYRQNGAATAEMIPYPADDKTEYLDGAHNQMEWRPYGALLSVVGENGYTICRYDDEPLCLVCYSVATSPEGFEAEVVVHRGALAEGDVQEGQWKGKIVFTNQFPSTVAAAVGKSGALGLVSDCIAPPWLQQYPPVREPEDTPDLVMWTIFGGTRNQPQIFGFNLSPRQGRRLRALIADSDEPVRLRAVVNAETVEGSSDFVHATLPGTDLAHEEIWVLAHLSEPGARDNASGCCASVELLRTLKALIDVGKLPPLRRTIRFMHGVEVSGFLPYINEHRERLPQIVAGLCADSLAENFGTCGGQILFFRSPEANASFIDGLCEMLLQAVAAEPVGRFGADNYAIFPWKTMPFWGNDAFVSDGFFDIPTPQFSAWPDKHYHSSMDRPEDIDEGSLARMGAVTGTFLYLLATAGAEQARWFGALAVQDFKRRISARVTEVVAEVGELPLADETAEKLAAELWHLGLQGHDAVTQAARFAPDDEGLAEELVNMGDELLAFAACEGGNVAGQETGFEPPEMDQDCDGAELVARRRRWRLANNPAGELGARLWPWINGRRAAWEIAERLQFSGAAEVGDVVSALRVLEAAELVEFV
ncbi:MAG: hypothetical protein KKI08_23980 [Armatimonadetes bacterium]|nr:hypothetical protein [Armatimonadota bacterium]